MRSLPPPSGPADARHAAGGLPLSFRVGLNAMIGLLGLQFLLGMAVTLYVRPSSLPSNLSGLLGPSAGSAPGLAVVHAGIGAVLGVWALVLMPWSHRVGRPSVFYGCVAGGLSVLTAGVAGASFLSAGQPPAASFLMAAGFLAAFWAYFWTRVQGERLAPR
jgi:hypothetical protein